MAFRYKRRRLRKQFRRIKRRLYKKKKTKSPHRVAARIARKDVRKNKTRPFFKLQRPIAHPAHRILHTSNLSPVTITAHQMLLPNGIYEYDYTIADILKVADYDWIKANYNLYNINSVVVTFFILNVDGLTQAMSTGTGLTNPVYTQCTWPLMEPNLMGLHCNSSSIQSTYAGINIGSSNYEEKWYYNPTVFKLTQKQRAVRQWHLPVGYSSARQLTSSLTMINALDASINGPPNNEPHGVVFLWSDYNYFPRDATGTSRITIGMRFDVVWSLFEPLPIV